MNEERTDSASSDFKIICDNDTYDVHHFVISLHSGYFKRLCQGGFQEAREHKVTLHEDSPFAVKLMVDWFYSFGYTLAERPKGRSALEVHSWMFTLADKYDIPNLKTFALAGVQRILALPYSDEQLNFRSQNLLAGTSHAFKNAPPTDDRLCKALVAGWVANDKRILRHMNKEDLQSAMAETPEFASALVAELGGLTLKTKGQGEGQGESGTTLM